MLTWNDEASGSGAGDSLQLKLQALTPVPARELSIEEAAIEEAVIEEAVIEEAVIEDAVPVLEE